MINLLPPATKRQIRAARANVLLVRYTILSVVVVVLLGLGTFSVYLVMGSIKTNAENTIADNHSQISNYASVQAEASEFRSNLSTARNIMDKEIIYSQAVLSVAQLIPSGVTLDNLSLNSSSFGSPMTINAKARSYQHAIRLKQSLERSDIFSDVHFSTLSDASGSSSPYPYSVTLTATLSREIPQP